MRRSLPIIYLALLLLFMVGCKDGSEPVIYTEPVPEPPQMMAGHDHAAEEKELTWTLPADWTESRTSGMILSRITAPEIPGASITLSRLEGTGGGINPNIQRWAGQLGLPQLSDTDLEAVKSALKHGGAKGTFIDFNTLPSVKETTMNVCILEYPDFTVYLKITGNSEAVSKFSDKLKSLAQSISYK
ncbi:MAG: hypothetical protein PVG39_30140 [Desulfobacteraceae bacterium]|jgi:hypothetical protein